MSIIKRKLVENTIQDSIEVIELATELNEKTENKTDLKKEILVSIYELIIKITSLNRDISTHLSCRNGDLDTLANLQRLLKQLSVNLHETLNENLDAQNLSEYDLVTDKQEQILVNFNDFANDTIKQLPTLSYKKLIHQYILLTRKYRSLFEEGVNNFLVEDKYYDAVDAIKYALFKHINYMHKVADEVRKHGINGVLSLYPKYRNYNSLLHDIKLLNEQILILKKAGLLDNETYEKYSYITRILNPHHITV